MAHNKKTALSAKDGSDRVTTLVYLFFTKKTSAGTKIPSRSNGRNPSQPMQKAVGAKLQGHLQRLLLRLFSACRGSLWHSVAAYSPFHCSCSNKFHSTIFPSFLSMDTVRRNLKISFSTEKAETLCFLCAFFERRGLFLSYEKCKLENMESNRSRK